MSKESSLAELACFLDAGYLAANPPALQRLCLAAYRLLARGRPLLPAELADACSVSGEDVDALLALIPASAYDRRPDGAFTAFIGLSLEATAHEFVVSRRGLYTWCVFDALFLPALLGSEAALTTTCPATRREIRISIRSEGANAVSPARPVMSIAAPDKAACCNDLRGAFCDHVNFFADETAFERWNKGGGACVTLDDAFALAMRRNAARFPDIDPRDF